MYDFGLASTTGGAGRPGSQDALDHVGPAAVRLEPAAEPLGEQVEDHEAGVVPGARVRRARGCPARRRASGRQPRRRSAAWQRRRSVEPGRRRRTRPPRRRALGTLGALGGRLRLLLGGRRGERSAMIWSGSADQRRCPSGSTRSPARTSAPTSRPSTSTTISARDVGGLGLDATRAATTSSMTAADDACRSTRDRDLDGDLLAAAHDDQVDVLEGLLDRVALDRLGQGQLAPPSRSTAAGRWRS